MAPPLIGESSTAQVPSRSSSSGSGSRSRSSCGCGTATGGARCSFRTCGCAIARRVIDCSERRTCATLSTRRQHSVRWRLMYDARTPQSPHSCWHGEASGGCAQLCTHSVPPVEPVCAAEPCAGARPRTPPFIQPVAPRCEKERSSDVRVFAGARLEGHPVGAASAGFSFPNQRHLDGECRSCILGIRHQ